MNLHKHQNLNKDPQCPVVYSGSPEKIDSEWYRTKLMKPDDKDAFGNEGSLFPSDDYIIFVSLTKTCNS